MWYRCARLTKSTGHKTREVEFIQLQGGQCLFDVVKLTPDSVSESMQVQLLCDVF